MMITVRVIQWIARIAWLCALILGLLYWTRINTSLVDFHMLLGLTLTLSLLIMSIIAMFTRGIRLLGVGGFVYALIIPVFGMTQAGLLMGDWHWLIQVAHLLVGIGGIALVQAQSTRFEQSRQARGQEAMAQAKA